MSDKEHKGKMLRMLNYLWLALNENPSIKFSCFSHEKIPTKIHESCKAVSISFYLENKIFFLILKATIKCGYKFSSVQSNTNNNFKKIIFTDYRYFILLYFLFWRCDFTNIISIHSKKDCTIILLTGESRDCTLFMHAKRVYLTGSNYDQPQKYHNTL